MPLVRADVQAGCDLSDTAPDSPTYRFLGDCPRPAMCLVRAALAAEAVRSPLGGAGLLQPPPLLRPGLFRAGDGEVRRRRRYPLNDPPPARWWPGAIPAGMTIAERQLST